MLTIDFEIIITYPSKQNHQRLKYNGLSSVLINRHVKLRVALHVGLPTICQRRKNTAWEHCCSSLLKQFVRKLSFALLFFSKVLLNIKQPMLSCLICRFSCRRLELKIDLSQPQTCGTPEQAYTKVSTVGLVLIS